MSADLGDDVVVAVGQQVHGLAPGAAAGVRDGFRGGVCFHFEDQPPDEEAVVRVGELDLRDVTRGDRDDDRIPRGRALGHGCLLEPDELPGRRVDEAADVGSRDVGADRVDDLDDAGLAQEQGFRLALVQRQALRGGLGGVERVGRVDDGDGAPSERTQGRAFAGRSPAAELQGLVAVPERESRGRRQLAGLGDDMTERWVLKCRQGKGGRRRVWPVFVSFFFDFKKKGGREKEKESRLLALSGFSLQRDERRASSVERRASSANALSSRSLSLSQHWRGSERKPSRSTSPTSLHVLRSIVLRRPFQKSRAMDAASSRRGRGKKNSEMEFDQRAAKNGFFSSSFPRRLWK